MNITGKLKYRKKQVAHSSTPTEPFMENRMYGEVRKYVSGQIYTVIHVCTASDVIVRDETTGKRLNANTKEHHVAVNSIGRLVKDDRPGNNLPLFILDID